MSQPTVHSFHVTFYTTKFHFNRDMDNALKFAVMKTELYAIILTIFIYITHVHLFCLFSKAVRALPRGTSWNYQGNFNSATLWLFCNHKGQHPHLTIWKAKERKEKKTKTTEQTNNKQICLKEWGLASLVCSYRRGIIQSSPERLPWPFLEQLNDQGSGVPATKMLCATYRGGTHTNPFTYTILSLTEKGPSSHPPQLKVNFLNWVFVNLTLAGVLQKANTCQESEPVISLPLWSLLQFLPRLPLNGGLWAEINPFLSKLLLSIAIASKLRHLFNMNHLFNTRG